MPLDRFRSLALPLAILALGAGCASGLAPREPARGRVVIVSIDGLLPDFYLSPGFEAPHLRRLASLGASAEGAETIYPSVTYPSHTTIVSGVRSARHGILSNTLDPADPGADPVWYWDTRHLKVPTLWSEAEAAGRKTAILTWPVSVGARVSWLVPEIFPGGPRAGERTWDLTRRHMDPGFLQELLDSHKPGDEKELEGFEQRDRWVAQASHHVLSTHRPDLTLIHLIHLDHVEHRAGKSSAEARRALQGVDAQLGRILEAVDLKETTVIVLGDHGFYDYDKVINLPTLFAGRKWDARLVVQQGGSQAIVYSRDPGRDGEILAALRRRAGGAYRVIGREELDRLEAFPGALCAIDPVIESRDAAGRPAPGYAIGTAATGPLITRLPAPRGNHGPLPSQAPLRAGFVAAGPGIPAGRRLGVVRLLDVAPTAARILGIRLPLAEGRAIDL